MSPTTTTDLSLKRVPLECLETQLADLQRAAPAHPTIQSVRNQRIELLAREIERKRMVRDWTRHAIALAVAAREKRAYSVTHFDASIKPATYNWTWLDETASQQRAINRSWGITPEMFDAACEFSEQDEIESGR